MATRLLILNLNPCYDHWILLDRRPQMLHTLRGESVVHQIDGKGLNIARVLGTLGSTDHHCLNVLGGTVGKIIADRAAAIGIPATNVWIQAESRINTALVHRYDRRRDVQMINESGPSMSAHEVAEVTAVFSTLVRRGDLVVVSGSAPTGFEPDDLRRIARIATHGGAQLAVDIAGSWLTALVEAHPAILKVNDDEFRLAFAIDPGDIDSLRGFQRDHGIEQLTITYGKRGSVTISDDRVLTAVPPVVAADYAVGSGDAFFAGYLFGYVRRMEMLDALRIATACGAANAVKFGAALITRREYEAYLSRVTVMEGSDAVLLGR